MTKVIKSAMKRDKEVSMRGLINSSALLAAAFVVSVGGSARAATIDVKVPFPFVVNGQTLPAGEYRVERDSIEPSVVLIRGEKGNTTTMLVMTRPAAGHDPAGDKPSLTFSRFENQYRLSDVWDSSSHGVELVGR